MKDYFSQWPDDERVADDFINKWVTRCVLMELRLDQERNFELAVIQEMCQKLGIR